MIKHVCVVVIGGKQKNMTNKPFAVVKTGGKQYKVCKDDVVRLEKLIGEPGTEITLEEVLMLGEGSKSLIIGSPLVSGASVVAQILSHVRDPKIIVFKKQRRQNHRRKHGHRQSTTHVLIKDILKK
jgi:large subunit ribosomal protein L21